MIGTQQIEEIIKLVLWTGYIDNENPLSSLLLSEVEGGKTFLVSQFRKNNGIAFPHDATAFGIIRDYKQELKEGEIKHFIFPEFVFPLARQKETVQTFLAFLNGLMEEGITDLHTFATTLKLPKPIRAGIIACLAKAEFAWRKNYWTSIGFLSRFLPISYAYSERVETAIFEAIYNRDSKLWQEIPIMFHSKEVYLPPELARKLNPLTKEVIKGMGLTIEIAGFRMQHHLQRLAMASALDKNRSAVNQEDIDRVIDLSKFFNLNYTKI